MALSDDIQKLYIAYFNRPADPGGLAYWIEQASANGGSTAAIAQAFSGTAEYRASYAGLSSADVVNKVYQNLFGRPAEPGGLAFWTSMLDAGTLSVGNIVTAVFGGAQGGDVVVLTNKTEAAGQFTASLKTPEQIAAYSTPAAAALATKWLETAATPEGLQAALTGLTTVIGTIVTGMPPVDTGGGGSGDTALPFIVTYEDGRVGFANATQVTMSHSGGIYTFTSGVEHASVDGVVSIVKVPEELTLTTDLASTDGLAFEGQGTIVLTDTSASAAALSTLNRSFSGLVDASSITSFSGLTSIMDALNLLVENNGSVGNVVKTAPGVTLALGESMIFASDLKAIAAGTTGLVDATAATALVGATTADAIRVLVTERGTSGDKINLSSDIQVIISDRTANAADLKVIEAATTGIVDARDIHTLMGTATDNVHVLRDLQGTHGDKIWLGLGVDVVLTDTEATATKLLEVEGVTTGFVDARSVTDITNATAAQAQTLLFSLRGTSGNAIQFAPDVNVTITSAQAMGVAIADILARTTGEIRASAVTAITNMSIETAMLALVTREGSVTFANDVAIGLDGTSFEAADLLALDERTTGLITFSWSSLTVTGTLAEVQALYANNGSSGNAIRLLPMTDIVITDSTPTPLAASVFQPLDQATSGMITADNMTSIIGSLYDVRWALESILDSPHSQLDRIIVTDTLRNDAFRPYSLPNDTTLVLTGQDTATNYLTFLGTEIRTGNKLIVDATGSVGTFKLDARAVTDNTISIEVKTGPGVGTGIWGGSGNDIFHVSANDLADAATYVHGGPGADTLNIGQLDVAFLDLSSKVTGVETVNVSGSIGATAFTNANGSGVVLNYAMGSGASVVSLGDGALGEVGGQQVNISGGGAATLTVQGGSHADTIVLDPAMTGQVVLVAGPNGGSAIDQMDNIYNFDFNKDQIKLDYVVNFIRHIAFTEENNVNPFPIINRHVYNAGSFGIRDTYFSVLDSESGEVIEGYFVRDVNGNQSIDGGDIVLHFVDAMGSISSSNFVAP